MSKNLLLKIVILGDSGVGKTAILSKYVNNEFIRDHKATIGADFLIKELQIPEQKLEITLQIWDTAGQERFKALGNAFYRGADIVALVYNIADARSFDSVQVWKQEFEDFVGADESGPVTFMILGNKADLDAERQVPKTRGESSARESKAIFFETSALNGQNISKAFEEACLETANRYTRPNRVVHEPPINTIKLDEPVSAPAVEAGGQTGADDESAPVPAASAQAPPGCAC